MHLATQSTERVKAVLSGGFTSAATTSGTIKFYALVPPDTETQKLVECTIRCKEFPNIKSTRVDDARDPNKKYLLLEVPLAKDTLKQPLTSEITYTVDLKKTVLFQGAGSNASTLAPWERKTDVEATPTLNFDDPAFQDYLHRSALIKQADESNSEFAYRAFRAVSAELASRVKSDGPPIGFDNMKASIICRPTTRDGQCGCCAILFTSVLRANGVPSRLLVGRWAKDPEGTYGQFHVRSDFFDPAVGWAPVDPTFGFFAVRDKVSPDVNFGLNNADFITFHLNTDLAPKGSESATAWIRLHQFGIAVYDGKAPYSPKYEPETWKVTKG